MKNNSFLINHLVSLSDEQLCWLILILDNYLTYGSDHLSDSDYCDVIDIYNYLVDIKDVWNERQN